VLPRVAVVARSHAAMLCIVAVVACFLYAGVLSSRPLMTHEGLETYRRVHEYQQELRNGNWFPQVFPDAVRGAGYAFPSLYPPFSYMVAVALAFVFSNIVWGVNVALLLAVILSGWAMYWCLLVVNADRRIALASALLYISFPYRFVDVFVRGALAESWSFVWMPLIVAGAWATFTRRRLVWYLPVAWAGLFLTHSVIALYLVLVFGLLALLGLRWGGWRTAALLAVGLALGAGLSAWYLLPQQHLLPGVHAHDPYLVWADRAFVERQSVSPRNLTGRWNNGWRGPDATVKTPIGACPHYFCGLSFEVGTGSYLMVALLVAWYASLALAFARRLRAPPGHPLVTWLVSVALVAYVLYLAFMLQPGFFLRRLPKAFGYIQFPWRLMGPIALLTAIVVGVLAASRMFPRWVRYSVVVICALVAVTVPRFQKEADYLQTDERAIVAGIATNGDRGFTALGEYAPNDIDSFDLDRELVSAPEVRGSGRVLRWERRHGDVYATVSVDSDTPSTVVFPILYYDFYRVAGADRTVNVQGLLGARVLPGQHRLHVSHRPTAVNLAAFAITFLSAGLLVLLVRTRRFAAAAAIPGARRTENRRVEDPRPLRS
jgi:hypothetical protein